ncbi:ABC-F family ATP-binding cassette domain-containing protein [Candidatus Peregrinibacteria bacterium]|mgnify:FL=1|jgi:ATP-binding cassette, subfamily F, member 3|nr:ABC-F family ATP-binding cassette domain-containing protein [Candidatus Peregrinibacteria bacterium]MBT7337414.1 ABC-F family ATP-binding cassette domain-containing protein [Candidatus Peregrinibacteria bacterium]
MDHGDVILRFQDVSFQYEHKKPIMEEASFVVRKKAKLTIVGQNGAGKSTIFKMIMKELKPTSGEVHIKKGTTIGIAKQVVNPEDLTKTVQEFFEGAFSEKKYDIERDIARVLDVVNLHADRDKVISAFSGGQKARLLLAYAIIQEPDILLLDEPTNNLDAEGIFHLTQFLIDYEKTCVVISHDAGFLSSFTHGVLHLDSNTYTVAQYVGDYFDVVEQIKAQVERDQRQNARMKRDIADQKDKINFFAHKGGKMRKLASKMRDNVEEAESNKVDVLQEDKTINPFTIGITPCSKPLVEITSLTVMKNHKPTTQKVQVTVRKNHRLLITGPNGIGKSTLLEAMAGKTEQGAIIPPEVKVGYYRQDFSGLDMEKTVYDTLADVMEVVDNQRVYSTAAHFLLQGDKVKNVVGNLSEGQKGLLCFARFVLLQPTLLILDEPTNHINFRHLPVIAAALNKYEGGMILVSHDDEFVSQITTNEELNLGVL